MSSYTKTIFALLVLIILASSLLVIAPYRMTRTPELLGDANAFIVRTPFATLGFTWNDYAGFFLFGMGYNSISCTLTQVWGGEIYQYNGPMDCHVEWQNQYRFRGWIDFRGHPRPFCGATVEEKLPDLCMWR